MSPPHFRRQVTTLAAEVEGGRWPDGVRDAAGTRRHGRRSRNFVERAPGRRPLLAARHSRERAARFRFWRQGCCAQMRKPCKLETERSPGSRCLLFIATEQIKRESILTSSSRFSSVFRAHCRLAHLTHIYSPTSSPPPPPHSHDTRSPPSHLRRATRTFAVHSHRCLYSHSVAAVSLRVRRCHLAAGSTLRKRCRRGMHSDSAFSCDCKLHRAVSTYSQTRFCLFPYPCPSCPRVASCWC